MSNNQDFFKTYFKNDGECHPKLAYQALSRALIKYIEELDPVDKMKFQADIYPFIKEAIAEAQKMEKDLIDNTDITLIEPEKVYTINPNLSEKNKVVKMEEVTHNQEPLAVADYLNDNSQFPIDEQNFSLPEEWDGDQLGVSEDIPFGLFVPDAEIKTETFVQPVLLEEDFRTPEEIQEDMKKAIMLSSSRLFNNIATQESIKVEDEIGSLTAETKNAAPEKSEEYSPNSVGSITDEDDFADSFIVGKQIH